MKRLSQLTLVLAVLSAVFFLLLIFLRVPFALYPLMSWQDALDLLTPLILIPLYWLIFKAAGQGEASRNEELMFMIFAAVWVLGHGMHLAANSIDNLAEGMAKQHVIDITATDIYRLTYFFDEHLSHYFWHAGVLGLALTLILREARHPADIQTVWWATALGGVIYGLTYFSIFLEGQTVPLGLPAAILISGWALLRGRTLLSQRPVLSFFLIACLLATILFIGWGIYWRGFPQFTDVGLI